MSIADSTGISHLFNLVGFTVLKSFSGISTVKKTVGRADKVLR